MKRRTLIIGSIGTLIVLMFGSWIGVRTLFDRAAMDLKHGSGRQALRILKPLVTLGDSSSQHLVGETYAYGIGVEKDPEQALYWFRRSGLTRCAEFDPAAVAAYQVAQRYLEVDTEVAKKEGQIWLYRAKQLGYDGSVKCLVGQ